MRTSLPIRLTTNSSFKIVASLILGPAAALLVGCATSPPAPAPFAPTTGVTTPTSQSQQQAMTPDQALARLVDGNKRFTAGKSLNRDYVIEAQATSTGQYPFATVLSCIDSRSIPEVVFDQGIGDLFVPRVAGNYAPTDIIGSIEFATKVAGSKLVVVMGHTECGAVKGACDNVELGNLTTVIQAIRPATDDVQDVPGERTSKNKKFVYAVTVANVHRTVAKLRQDSPILRDLEQSGKIKIVGAMHDLATGEVVFFPWSQ
jgi:carbonic anhydrase